MTNPQVASIVGTAAGLITVLSFIPQAVRAWRTKHTKDLSRGTFVLLVVQSAGWLAYGLLVGQAPIIWTNAGVLLITLSILVAKFTYG